MAFVVGLFATIGLVLFGVLCAFLATLPSTELLAIVLGLGPLLGLHLVALAVVIGFVRSRGAAEEPALKVEQHSEQLVAA